MTRLSASVRERSERTSLLSLAPCGTCSTRERRVSCSTRMRTRSMRNLSTFSNAPLELATVSSTLRKRHDTHKTRPGIASNHVERQDALSSAWTSSQAVQTHQAFCSLQEEESLPASTSERQITPSPTRNGAADEKRPIPWQSPQKKRTAPPHTGSTEEIEVPLSPRKKRLLETEDALFQHYRRTQPTPRTTTADPFETATFAESSNDARRRRNVAAEGKMTIDELMTEDPDEDDIVPLKRITTVTLTHPTPSSVSTLKSMIPRVKTSNSISARSRINYKAPDPSIRHPYSKPRTFPPKFLPSIGHGPAPLSCISTDSSNLHLDRSTTASSMRMTRSANFNGCSSLDTVIESPLKKGVPSASVHIDQAQIPSFTSLESDSTSSFSLAVAESNEPCDSSLTSVIDSAPSTSMVETDGAESSSFDADVSFNSSLGLSQAGESAITNLHSAMAKLGIPFDACKIPAPKFRSSSISVDQISTSHLLLPPSSNRVNGRRKSLYYSPVDSIIKSSSPLYEHFKQTNSAPKELTKTNSTILEGVIAFVDVRTAEGTDASAMFIELLKSLGARVLVKLSDSVTHILFKAGRPATVQKYRAMRPTPFIVGVGWAAKCKELQCRVDESTYAVEPTLEIGNRRRSVEPRQLQLALSESFKASSHDSSNRRKSMSIR